jgi:hypothetical protein
MNKPFLPTYLYIKHHSVTGKLYFGKTTKMDPIKYSGSGKHWKRHIKLHGIDYVETLWYCLFYEEEIIREFAIMCSKQWNIIKGDRWLNIVIEDGINGGSRGRPYLEETRRKVSLALKGKTTCLKGRPSPLKGRPSGRKGKKLPQEWRDSIGKANIGKNYKRGFHLSEETKNKISNSLKGRPSPNKGKVTSEATKRKISNSCKGKSISDEQKIIISNTHKGKILSIETRMKMSLAAKGRTQHKVECPHCQKIGSISSMKRYHFDNCKTFKETNNNESK